MKNKIMGVNNFFDRYNHITFFKGFLFRIFSSNHECTLDVDRITQRVL
jgi:hypothetical protein